MVEIWSLKSRNFKKKTENWGDALGKNLSRMASGSSENVGELSALYDASVDNE